MRRAMLQLLGLGPMMGTGDGLRRPLNAPTAAPITPGVQPGNQSPVVIANQVIVFGPTGKPVGVFVYRAGTRPALGNPPIAWLTSGTRDPYGNALPSTSGVAGSGTFEAGNTIIKALGEFTYSGTPAAGNLIASITPAAGINDGLGNPFAQGINAYVAILGTKYAVGLNQLGGPVSAPGLSIVNVSNPASIPAGVFGESSNTTPANQATIYLYSGEATATDTAAYVLAQSQVQAAVTSGLLDLVAGSVQLGATPTVTVDDNNTSVTIANSVAAHSALVVSSTAVSPANLISIMAPAAGNNALGILVTGDTFGRLKIDSNGKLQWGTGAAGQDTILQRSAAGVLQATSDIVGTIPAGTTAEVWHVMPLVNGWANAAGNVLAQYRRIASPPNSVEIIGTINATAASSTTFFTLPAGYRPIAQQSIPCAATGGQVAGSTPFIQCDTAGILSLQHGTITVNDTYLFHGTISLDA